MVNRDHRKTSEELYALSIEDRVECVVKLLDDIADKRQWADEISDDRLGRENWILNHLADHPTDAPYFNMASQLAPVVAGDVTVCM